MDKLEEIKKHHRDTVSFRSSTTKYEREHAWLISEVERLLSYVDGNDKDVEIADLEARVKELEEQVESDETAMMESSEGR